MSEQVQALLAVFENTADDLAANQDGRISERQRAYHHAEAMLLLKLGMSVLLVLTLVFSVVLVALDTGQAVPLLLLLAMAGFAVLLLRHARRTTSALAAGVATALRGRLDLQTHISQSASRGINNARQSTPQHFLRVQDRLFRVTKTTYDALAAAGIVGNTGTVYYVPNTQVVLAVELA